MGRIVGLAGVVCGFARVSWAAGFQVSGRPKGAMVEVEGRGTEVCMHGGGCDRTGSRSNGPRNWNRLQSRGRGRGMRGEQMRKAAATGQDRSQAGQAQTAKSGRGMSRCKDAGGGDRYQVPGASSDTQVWAMKVVTNTTTRTKRVTGSSFGAAGDKGLKATRKSVVQRRAERLDEVCLKTKQMAGETARWQVGRRGETSVARRTGIASRPTSN